MSKSIKDILAEKLKEAGESTSAEEKADAMKYLDISMPTLYKYISGDTKNIGKVDKATELLQFLSEKVKARIEKIRETNLV